MKGIQVCSNEGPRSVTSGYNSDIEKICYDIVHLKIFWRIIEPISTKLGTKYHIVREIQDCLKDGSV